MQTPDRRKGKAMEQKELKKLSRADLLEMLVDQSIELQQLQLKYEIAQKALEERVITIERAGSIAEAALQLNGVFEAAQRACDQYTANIEKLNARQHRICSRMEKETRENCRKMVAETRKECDRMLEEAQIQAVACRNGTDKSQALSDSRAVLQALIDNKDFYRNE